MYLLAILLLNIIYIAFFFAASIRLKIVAPHYFLGFGRKLFSFKISDTQFTVGFYIPIIGFASIYTYSDGVKHPMKYPWEFFGLPIAKRLWVTFSGAIGLFIIGTLVFIALAYVNKESIITKEEVNRHGIYPSKTALKFGFQRGDKVVALNGKEYTHFYELVDPKVITKPDTYYTILRDNKEIDIHVSISPDSLNRNEYFFSLLAPFVVEYVEEGSTAERAGLVKGDRILKVNEHPIIKFYELNEAFLADNDGTVMLTVERSKVNESTTLNMEVDLYGERKLGILPRELINYTTKQNSLFESIAIGFHNAVYVPIIQLKAFAKLLGGTISVKKSIGGPVRIAEAFTTYWRPFAFIAVNVLLLNFLPLPKSAFWELIPLAYEGITRKQFSDKLFRLLGRIAIVILILLFVLSFIMDVKRLIN